MRVFKINHNFYDLKRYTYHAKVISLIDRHVTFLLFDLKLEILYCEKLNFIENVKNYKVQFL